MNRTEEERNSRKRNIIQKLQEQNTEIISTIKKLQEDWILNQQIINKLQYKEESSPTEEENKEFSKEFI